MEGKKDFSTAILEQKRAHNKLQVFFFIIQGLRGFK